MTNTIKIAHKAMKSSIIKITCLYLLVTGLAALTTNKTQAQQKEVREAQSLYRQVKRARENGRLFESISELNKTGLRMPLIGTYNRIERYFYKLTVEKKPILRTILIKIERNNIRYNQEFLFNLTGEPVYIFESQNDFKKYKYRTLKIYYNKDKPVQWVKGRAVIDGRFLKKEHLVRVEELLSKAKKYYQKYKIQVKGIDQLK
ncbi:hypothetical protein M23134_05526 [Microscilla marina ATCC 23134]|uniref:Lipoprotein n=2 Tax=Microscilla marina TaxID=1027 RepID=A1ZXY7_MICM2|nr:hypothetical protein M23134_05526 [Microscilla marina ATCC 23134]